MKYPTLARQKYRISARQLLLQLMLTFLLSAAQLSSAYAPFALAVLAVAGPKLPGLCCLIGTAIGALVFFDFQSGLRYAAAAILIFSANIAFYDSHLYRKKAFLPAVSALMLLLVQSVYLLERSAEQWILCLAAAAIMVGSICLLRALSEQPQQRRLFLLAALLVGASRFTPICSFSPGRALLAALALITAGAVEPALGIIIGAGIGLAVDLVPDPPQLLFSVVYGVSTALISLCRRQPRPVVAAAFCLPCAVLPILFGAESPPDLVFEALLAGAVYLLLPSKLLPFTASKASSEDTPSSFQACLSQSAAAFRDLYDSFFRGTKAPPPENPSVVFDRAAQQVCRKCVLCSDCWQRNYNMLYNAFNDACPTLLKRGQAQPGDFPLYFTSHCVHFPQLLQAINQELSAFLLRRQYHQRLMAAQQQAQEQYAQLGDLLSSADSSAAVATIAQPLGYRIGSALRPREGERICGDQIAVCEVGSTLYLLLSDGMGSGEEAHREAAMVVRLLQQFLKAGIDAAPALKTLNSAMALRGENGGGFTTIDLLAVRRQNGEATLYKYGAAPSYLKKSGSVTRISGQSLPAGLQNSADPPECTHLTLPAGSFLVMISDGIADAVDDEWLQNLLAGWNGKDCNTLTSLILSESRTRKGLGDDCAILVLQLPESELGRRRQV
ncbi:MAG: SpoIIE family protein phosphatase [Clostridiales bacterium]|nr:SpoIIE family protein phosphatase [Candidatus Cacconaster stercorequi]